MTHLDTDVLAEFRAGLITGRRGARIAAHLAGCARCTALDDQLAGVSVLLASVPAPAVPDHVAQRLDTVLAAEVARNNSSERARDDGRPGQARADGRPERARDDGAGEAAVPGRPPRNRGFRLLALRVLAPAAAVVLLAAGVFGLTRLNLGSSSSSSASSAAGAARSASSAVATAAGGAKSASGRVNGPVTSPVEGAAPRPLRMTPANFVVTTGVTNFSKTGFKQQVQADLRVPLASRPRLTPTKAVRACVRALAGGDTLQLVESTHFEGQPATLVVARTGADDTAWIAGPACSATNRDVLATASLPPGISGS
jgi:hypothetical protein